MPLPPLEELREDVYKRQAHSHLETNELDEVIGEYETVQYLSLIHI